MGATGNDNGLGSFYVFPRFRRDRWDTPLSQVRQVKEEACEAIVEGIEDSASDAFLDECIDTMISAETLRRVCIEEFGLMRFLTRSKEVIEKNRERGYWDGADD